MLSAMRAALRAALANKRTPAATGSSPYAAAGGGTGPFVGLWPVPHGRDWRYEPLHYDNDGHLLLVAPSRSGKGRDVLVWSLLTNTDSAVILDIKGELAAVTARARRAMGHEVYFLNPFQEPQRSARARGWNGHGFNPLAGLEPSSPFFVSAVDGLAAALIAHDPKASSHWVDSARALVAGLIMHEVVAGRSRPRARAGNVVRLPGSATDEEHWLPSLARVREWIAMSDEDFEASIRTITGPAHRAEVRDRLQAFAALTNELRSVRSTAKTETAWLSDPVMAEVTRRHDIDFADLKRRPMTVYVILPASLVSAGSPYSRFLRLVVQGVIEAIIATPRTSKRPVWLLIDELHSLGALPIIERMMSEGAGYGLQMQLVVHTLGQLKDLYGDNWETFVGNASVKQFFAPGEMMTAAYVSKLLGQATTYSRSINPKGEVSISETGVPLLRPEETMQLGGHEQIVFLRGSRPARLYRAPYYDPRWGFAGQFDTNPYHVA